MKIFFCLLPGYGTDFESEGYKTIDMKKMILILAFIAGGIVYKPAQAQVSINFNIGAQPVWGPVGYDYVEYYYMPDIGVYYYVPRHQFVYLSNGRWIFASYLPVQYRSYNLYSGYKVVINEPQPYLHYQTHRVVYAKYKGNYGRQVIIRNSNEPKYYVNRGHPKYNGGEGRGKGRGNGNGMGKGKH